MIRKIYLLLMLILLTSCSIQKNITLQDDYSKPINSEVATRIVKSFMIAGIEQKFSENQSLSFDEIFNYFAYHGFYDDAEFIREDLKSFSMNDENDYESTYCIPAEIVDDFLVSKFNTKINHDVISCYSEDSNSYSLKPYVGEYYYEIQILSIEGVGENQYKISFLEKSTVDITAEEKQYSMNVYFDGEFKYLSFSSSQ